MCVHTDTQRHVHAQPWEFYQAKINKIMKHNKWDEPGIHHIK